MMVKCPCCHGRRILEVMVTVQTWEYRPYPVEVAREEQHIVMCGHCQGEGVIPAEVEEENEHVHGCGDDRGS